jgi:1,4-alpha-glucan branching enzyme
MGNILHDQGCTFRIWAIFAKSLSVKIWAADGTTKLFVMAHDTADGYGTDVWSVFVPAVTDSQHYRYIVGLPNGSSVERVDPFARLVVFPNFTEASRDDSDARSMVTSRNLRFGAPFNAPGWNELVIYQLHVGTFYDQNHPGVSKIKELISQIPYLKDLGVNAVQFLPYSEFSAKLSLGYDPVQPYAMERDYGTPQEIADLNQALHDAGMRVLVDVVFNHLDVSSGGPPFPYSLFQFDGWGGNPCGIFFYGGEQMNTPFGGPRPDYGRDALRRYLRDNVRMFLEEYQADGVRFDSTKCIRLRQGPCGTFCCGSDIGDGRNFGWELMQEITGWVAANQPWKLTIAEDLDGNAAITGPSSNGGAAFDAQWDTDLQGSLINALKQPNDASVDVSSVARAMQFPSEGDPFKRVNYLESHDQANIRRVPDIISPGDAEGWFARKKSILGFAVTLTTPGIPMFFQGAELLDFRRWNPSDNSTNMDFSRKKLFPKLFQFYADMNRLRRGTPGLCGSGLNVFQANPSTKVLAYQRWKQGAGVDDIVVVANFSGTPYNSYTIGFPYPGSWHVLLNTDSNDYSDKSDFGIVNSFDTTAGNASWDGLPCSGNIGIGPYSLIVLSR